MGKKDTVWECQTTFFGNAALHSSSHQEGTILFFSFFLCHHSICHWYPLLYFPLFPSICTPWAMTIDPWLRCVCVSSFKSQRSVHVQLDTLGIKCITKVMFPWSMHAKARRSSSPRSLEEKRERKVEHQPILCLDRRREKRSLPVLSFSSRRTCWSVANWTD